MSFRETNQSDISSVIKMQRSDVSVAPDIVQLVSTSHMMEAVTV